MPLKIAIITDTHGNLPALEAALRAIAAEGCDAIYHTGDAIGFGPYPAEVVDRLLNTPNLSSIMGNHDEWFAFGLPHPQPTWMSDGELSHHQWVHAQLDPPLREVIARWPYAIAEEVSGVKLLFTHYGRNDAGTGFQPIIQEPTSSDLDRLFANQQADLIAYGHRHPASDIQGLARYVNPGTLGCGDQPIARFVLVTVASDGTCQLQKRAVPYDRTDLFRQFVVREVPERDFIFRVLLGQTTQPT